MPTHRDQTVDCDRTNERCCRRESTNTIRDERKRSTQWLLCDYSRRSRRRRVKYPDHFQWCSEECRSVESNRPFVVLAVESVHRSRSIEGRKVIHRIDGLNTICFDQDDFLRPWQCHSRSIRSVNDTNLCSSISNTVQQYIDVFLSDSSSLLPQLFTDRHKSSIGKFIGTAVTRLE